MRWRRCTSSSGSRGRARRRWPHYLPVDPDEQWRRLSARDESTSFRIERADMDHYATRFEAPSADELAGADDRPDDPDWTEWSRRRWHTLAQ